MATIKPIEGKTIHQIQSGQVIVDLCSVVKELVENSLDAGATNIDVRFRNQGLDSIEVQDNGDGISPHNYETLALKHHTSKLSDYSDLTTLQTFGFRGEALSSLCALSNFTVITCMAKDAPKGTKLEFEISGKLKDQGVIAAQKGTTVSVENLFKNLPVRRRELERKIKTEWSKVVGVLGQYACIQTGIKFSVSQQTSAKSKKTTLFSTKGNLTTRENVVNVFGAKTLTALIPLDLNLELEPTSAPSQKWSTQDDGGSKLIRIVGHISRPAYGEGRQTPDRQMFFVNARPCGLPQVAKAFNEVYKAYNASQSPFIFANIELDTHLYDVNVSPDKRTILLHDQTRMLETLKTELTALFESQDYTLPISQLPAQKQPIFRQLTISRENSRDTKTATSHTLTESVEEIGSDQAQSSDASDEAVGKNAHKKDDHKPQPAVVSKEMIERSRGSASLISDWVGRNVAERVPKGLPREAASKAPAQVSGTEILHDKRKLVEKLVRKREQAEVQDPNSEDEDTRTISEAPSSHQPPIQVRDYNRNMEELVSGGNASHRAEPSGAIEPAIPALRMASLASPLSTPSKNVRLSRPETIATITIGDHTVTSSIGTPSQKRRRIEESNSFHQSKKSGTTPSNYLSSFGSKLSQRFAAPGPTLESSLADEEDATVDENPECLQEERDAESDHSTLFVDQGAEVDTERAQSSDEDVAQEEEDLFHEHSEADNEEDDGEDDGDYIDETEKKAREEAKVLEMIKAAEDEAARPSHESELRAKVLLKGGAKKKDSTVHLIQNLGTMASDLKKQFQFQEDILSTYKAAIAVAEEQDALDLNSAEDRLSLTITKGDFAKMKIIGQFNLGFILATRVSESSAEPTSESTSADDLFIIDQHASDEKYNFERLQATTIVQSQRLVQPKTLDLTAMEEEIVLENLHVLETNGFIVTVDESGESPVGQRCQLVSLPLSRETVFTITDLDELIAMLAEHPAGSVPRPTKVRKMFAMRACRSSIMIGKTLTEAQMGRVVKHMGEIDKPWNCPHGRPTMRHLCGLRTWDEWGWKEETSATDWASYVRSTEDGSAEQSD